jgi:hypothetical protein
MWRYEIVRSSLDDFSPIQGWSSTYQSTLASQSVNSFSHLLISCLQQEQCDPFCLFRGGLACVVSSSELTKRDLIPFTRTSGVSPVLHLDGSALAWITRVEI